MGNIPANTADTYDQTQTQMKIVLDFQKPVKQELRQLLNWSLSQIRNIYAPFRRRKGSPLLTRSQFLRFIQLSRITSFYIYDNISKQQPINVFEIMAVLILTAHTTYSYKLQFIFNVFDLECNKNLQFYQLILMFKSVIRGFSFLTGQRAPENILLQKYARALFSRADLNNDQILQIGEILGWLQSNSDCFALFKIFQPSIYGKEDYHIFNQFVAYTNQQIEIILTRLEKVHMRQRLCEQDYLMLTPPAKKSLNKQNLYSKTTQSKYSKYGKFTLKTQSSEQITNKDRMQLSRSKFLPTIRTYTNMKTSSSMKKRKFQNIIIIKGRTITKKEVFELREYFDLLSIGKKQITIEDFMDSFNQEKYNHMKSIAASLFNFLDKKQSGRVEFLDLVTKLYPNLTVKHKETIAFWSEEYNRNFNLDKKIKANRNNEESKKRILPKSCIHRLKQLYQFFDYDKKGYVNMDNLHQILGNASTQREIKEVFERCDQDRDGKLCLKEFAHVLLPPDLQIQGLI